MATYGSVTADTWYSSTGQVFSPASGSATMKNRIINGAMMIDQRNSGASVTGNDGVFTVDRWVTECSQSSKFTAQQNAGSVTPPPGFVNYLGFTSSSAYTSLAGDYFNIVQRIEGNTVSDLDFGKSTAKTVTISFWARSSLTGTFGGSLRSANASRSYPFTYSVASANTWVQYFVTIPGCTDGTWGSGNSSCMYVYFNLGTGTNLSGTPGSWASANYVSATGSVSIVGTSGATLYITGVQLEQGPTASGFDYRHYGTELALCQRYYWQFYGFNAAGTTYMRDTVYFKVSMRSAPTGTVYASTPSGSGTGTANKIYQGTGETAASTSQATTETIRTDSTGYTANVDIFYLLKLNAEL